MVRTGTHIALILRTVFLTAVCAAAVVSTAAQISAPTPAGGRWRDATMDEYRQHLVTLGGLVQTCAKARDIPHCDPTLVGLDDRIPLTQDANATRRLIRYGWLRVLFSKAEDADQPAPKPASNDAAMMPPRPSTSQLLQDAVKRLADDLAQTNNLARATDGHSHERETMRQVLAGPEFRNLDQATVQDTMLEKVGNWLNRLFAGAAKLKPQSAWIGRLIVLGFIVAVCVGLIFALLRLERRWRIRLAPEAEHAENSAASARDWQLWLSDARTAAAAGQWREAIHFAYWAAISRLESKRLWPADRARTPREYLKLVSYDDPRKAVLTQLTGSFERTWYGARPAGQGEYQSAEELANSLIKGSGGSGATRNGSPSEGGMR